MTKIPRFAFEKFKGAEALLSTVDEVGRRGDGDRPQLRREPAEGAARAGDGPVRPRPGARAGERRSGARSRARLARATPDRLLVAAEALRQGFTVERINEIAGFDPWFLERLEEIVEAEEEVRINGLPSDARGMRRLKAMGFSDARLAQLVAPLGACRARDERGGRGGRFGHGAQRHPGDDRRDHRGRGARPPAAARRAPGVQAHRQLRRGVRCGDALSLLDLRGAAVRRARGRGRGQRPAGR